MLLAVGAWAASVMLGDWQWRAVVHNPLARRVLARTQGRRSVSWLRIGYLLTAELVLVMTLGLAVWGLLALGRLIPTP